MSVASISLDEAVDLARTGDVWLFRGHTMADRAIQVATNSPVNHVGMSVAIEDLPPLMWHAELGRSLPDVWTGTRHRGVQLHDLREAVMVWAARYGQRAWLRQLDPAVTAEMEGERTGSVFTFVHRGKWQERVADARAAVMGARDDLARYVEIAHNLLDVKITKLQAGIFVTEFIPAPPKGLATERVMANVEQARTKLREILASPTVEGAGIDGTAYGLVQAAGEYLDHVRTARTWETRLNRTLIRPEPLKHSAVKLALEVAKA